jgi:HEAT repeat protein
LLRLCLACDDRRVIETTVQAMRLVPDDSYVPLLLPLLERSRHRELARRALAAIGRTALDELARLLRDPTASHLLRRHLPESIRRFPAADAVPVLVAQLGEERDGMVAFKVLRSLNRLRANDPRLAIDEAIIVRELDKNVAAAFRYTHLRSVLLAGDEEAVPAEPTDGAVPSRTAAGELLIDVLHDKRIHATERAMRLLNLLLPHEDFRPIMRGYASDTGRLRASALEVIGAVLPVRYRTAMLGLLDDDGDVGADAVLAAAEGFYEVPLLTYREALQALMSLSGTTLRAIAAYHATELGMAGVVAMPAGPAERPSVRLLEELVRLRSMVGQAN